MSTVSAPPTLPHFQSIKSQSRSPAPPSPANNSDQYPSPPHSPDPTLGPEANGGRRRRTNQGNLAGGASGGGSRRRSRLDQTRAEYDDDEAGRVNLQPPKSDEIYETEEEWRMHHQREKTESSHHLPLVIVALPPLGAIIHGRAENWADAILVLLIAFYLYQLIKVPWDIYYASHGRVLVSGATQPAQGAFSLSPAEHRDRLHSIHVLRRTELLSLAATCLAPALGATVLWFARPLLSDPDRFINQTLITIFVIATGIKPFSHLLKLIQGSTLYHQEKVWHPSTEVHLLRRRVESLEKELGTLTRAFATKDDIRLLRDGVDAPLTQLGKAVRRFDRKEEYLRLSSEERFALLDARLEAARAQAVHNTALIDHLRREHEQASVVRLASTLIHSLLGVGQGGGGRVARRRRLRWYERGAMWYVFLPVNAGTRAIEWVGGGEDGGGEEREEGGDVVASGKVGVEVEQSGRSSGEETTRAGSGGGVSGARRVKRVGH